MSKSQLNKLKSEIKKGLQVTLNLSLNVVRDSNDETNFPHKLSLTDTQVSKISKLLQMVYQLIYNFQKLSCLGWYS